MLGIMAEWPCSKEENEGLVIVLYKIVALPPKISQVFIVILITLMTILKEFILLLPFSKIEMATSPK